MSNAFPWICWFLWISRNQLLIEKRPSTPETIILRAITAIKEWDSAQLLIKKPLPKAPIKPLIAQSLNLHPLTIRCNTDAAWKAGEAGLAWIFTDSEGVELNRGSQHKDQISSACMAEAMAIRSALLHAIDLHINHIWLRSDSQVLIRAISSGKHPAELYGVLSDISSITRLSFFRFRFLSSKGIVIG
ncbi:uncharacterized protein LOC130511119 [Raphanus sativus]|uniref:Uncharacterized protein LOC130511119 n=1 Tax=Raphanus sativus TaxID=3726 RepID=A0A9W3DJH5_RAPSA|nr:uncharacterized protein LOC130511119 [Raphanus sativus]